MSLVEKPAHWRPKNLEHLVKRAKIIADIREFFNKRNVLEVDTPLLSNASTTDPSIESFITYFYQEKSQKKFYLQTSPEFAMKRLLAAQAGPIYQICKAFRNGEAGKKHNPEFTILEWYRPGFDHHMLMAEVNLLLQEILNTKSAERISYADLFFNYFQINPHTCSLHELHKNIQRYDIKVHNDSYLQDKDTCLDLLLTHIIEPELGKDSPVMIFDYPATQAALAKIRHEEYAVGERFEAYFQGIELANGYHELGDVEEQLLRLTQDNEERKTKRLQEVPIDPYFISALNHGLPACAGVALGVDRLIMLALNANDISEVISFAYEHA